MGPKQSLLKNQNKFCDVDTKYKSKDLLSQLNSMPSLHSKYVNKENGNHPRAQTCFISIYHLFKEWRSIPKDILFSSLIILDCSRSFFIDNISKPHSNGKISTVKSAKSKSESKSSNDDSSDISDDDSVVTPTESVILRMGICNDLEFVSFILAKESQGHLLWVDTSIIDNKRMVNYLKQVSTQQKLDIPIDDKWLLISQWLSIHIDPISGNHYSPIMLSQQWWISKLESDIMTIVDPPSKYHYSQLLTQFHYSGDSAAIFYELSDLEWTFSAVSEILHQSNPTLIPMAKWKPNFYKQMSTLFNAAFDIDTNAEMETDRNGKSIIKRKINKTLIDANKATQLTAFDSRVSFGIQDDTGFVYIY